MEKLLLFVKLTTSPRENVKKKILATQEGKGPFAYKHCAMDIVIIG